MKAVRHLYVLGVAVLILRTTVAFTPAADAQTIHAMLIVMNDTPHTQELNTTNLKKVTHHLAEIKHELGCNLTIDSFHPLHADSEYAATREHLLTWLKVLDLAPDDVVFGEHPATRENLLTWLKAVDPAPNDVVFVYYSGDGETDNETQELFLTLQDADFPRKQLAEAIGALPCRLKMFITDTFSFDTPIWTPRFSPTADFHTTDAYGPLFLEHEGFLNITSAREGELSGGTSGMRGSWFTDALLDSTTDPRCDFNRDNFVSWKEVFKATQGRTRSVFSSASEFFSEGLKRKLDRIGQQSQHPKYYGQLPRRIRIGASSPIDTQTLHALFVVLDKQRSYLKGMEAMERLLEDVVETTDCNFEKTHLFASKQETTATNIQQWLKALRPGHNDIVFIYYHGDGYAGESGELYLSLLDNESFPRKAIAASMQRLACRLKILVTDAGSQGTPVTEPLDVFESLYRRKGKNQSLSREQAYTHLFFEHEGFLNLTAATEGERAFEDPKGGWFTRSLVKAMYEFHELDSNFDFFISWMEVFQRTRQNTMEVFHREAPDMDYVMQQELRTEGVRSQRPKYYGELPQPIKRRVFHESR